MREAVAWEQGWAVVAAAVRAASGRGWGLPLQPKADAETRAQMSTVRTMAAFLGD